MGDLKKFPEYLFQQNQQYRPVPSLAKAHKFIDNLINFLFPIKEDKHCSLAQISLTFTQLKLDFQELLTPLEKNLPEDIETLTGSFFKKFPDIYASLIKDTEAFMTFDPAAKSPEGIILYYPGFYSIAIYRFSHELYKLRVPFVPRMISEYAHSKTGIDIHPGAKIGSLFFIDHGTGIVIGETAIIGNNVKIYQGVTLGALFVEKSLANTKRHPTIEDNVIIYSGSTILGGNTVVGRDSVIGGNVWLTKSVPPYSLVLNESKTIIRDSKNFVEPINFTI